MKLKAINGVPYWNAVPIGRTSLIGHITTTRGELERVFGKPRDYTVFGNKVNFEWEFLFEDDDEIKVATVYDWKNYDRILKEDEQYHWHIGGVDESVFDALVDAFVQRGGKYQGASLGVVLAHQRCADK